MSASRQKYIRVRMSDSEHERLKALANSAGMTVSEYVRTLTSQKRIVNREDFRERTLKIAKLGNNLNQLAKWANTYKKTADVLIVIRHLMHLRKWAEDGTD